MPTIWGHLDRIEEDRQGTHWLQLRVTLPRGGAIRARTPVEKQTVVARGIARVDLSALHAGEVLEVSYHDRHDGFMEAEMIYARPEPVTAA
jgi:hypothetical protein